MDSNNNIILVHDEVTAVVSTYLISSPRQRNREGLQPPHFEIGICGFKFVTSAELSDINYKAVYTIHGTGTHFPFHGTRVLINANDFKNKIFSGRGCGKILPPPLKTEKVIRQYKGEEVMLEYGTIQLESAPDAAALSALGIGLTLATPEQTQALRKNKKNSRAPKNPPTANGKAATMVPPKKMDPRMTFNSSAKGGISSLAQPPPILPPSQPIAPKAMASTPIKHIPAHQVETPVNAPFQNLSVIQDSPVNVIQRSPVPQSSAQSISDNTTQRPVQESSVSWAVPQEHVPANRVTSIQIPGSSFNSRSDSILFQFVRNPDVLYSGYAIDDESFGDDYTIPEFDFCKIKTTIVNDFPSEHVLFISPTLKTLRSVHGLLISGEVWTDDSYCFALLG